MMHKARLSFFSFTRRASAGATESISPSRTLSLQEHPVKRFPLDLPTTHRRAHIPLEPIPVRHQVVRSLLVQRIASIRFQEQKLQSHHDSVQVKNRLPVLAQDIEADIPLEVDVGVVDLLFTLYFRRFVGEVLADGEGEVELAAFVEAFVGGDSEGKVEDVVGVGEGGFHGRGEGKFGEVWVVVY
jgi:hypothetical protein